VFIGVLGGSLQSNLGTSAGYNLLLFVFTGVIGQTLFQSTASGLISLIEDRENDFSQEIFIAPVSRFSIIFGKILGESLVAFLQVLAIIVFGLIIGLPITLVQVISILPVALIACLFGGAFGVIVMANLSSQRSANQIFPLIIFPQFFLSGVFSPITNLPPILFVLSRLAPMTYAVDLIRGVFYQGLPEYSKVVLHSPIVNLGIISVIFAIFLTSGTILFVRRERNR
jgi:ABC-2 type transport system permease protein